MGGLLMETMILSRRFAPRPSALLFVLGLLGSTLLSGFGYTPKNKVVATVQVGSLPFSLVVSPDSSTVYVGNEASDSISGIDTATNEVGFTISVSGQPFYLALTPDGSDLYCTQLNANADLEFSTATRQLLQSYATGSAPGPQAISPDGTLVYISNYNDGTVTVISNGTLLSPISVGGNPTAVIFSPDGSQAYVANDGLPKGSSYSVSVIDTATNTVSSVIDKDVPFPFGGMAFSPDGTKLYLTASNGHPLVVVIDTTTNQVDDIIVLRVDRKVPGQPAITPDGDYLYVPIGVDKIKTGNNQVLMVDTATSKVAGQIQVGTQPIAAAIAPDGTYAYVANYLDGTVSVIDITPK
jgi:YVTN family beta-propeller protein